MANNNIFREARRLLDKKDKGAELTEEEMHLLSAAQIPMNVRDSPIPQDIPIHEGLEELAKMVDESN